MKPPPRSISPPAGYFCHPFLQFLLLPPSMTLEPFRFMYFFLQLQGSATRAHLCPPFLPFVLLPPSMTPVDFLSKNLGRPVKGKPRPTQNAIRPSEKIQEKFCLWACPFFGSVSSVPFSLHQPAQISQSSSVLSLLLCIHLRILCLELWEPRKIQNPFPTNLRCCKTRVDKGWSRT